MTTPAKLDITIYQGDEFSVFVRVKGRDAQGVLDYLDLTGGTPKSQIRLSVDDAEPLAEFNATLTDQATLKGGILYTLTDAQTAALNISSTGVWDCEILMPVALGGGTRTLLAGSVTVIKQVTR